MAVDGHQQPGLRLLRLHRLLLRVPAAVPRRPRLLGASSVAVTVATSQAGGLPRTGAAGLTSTAVLLLLNVVIAVRRSPGSAGSATSRTGGASSCVAELSEANRKLEATLAENAGPARAAARPGPGGRGLRRAAADGAGDPRHPGPGPDRDHHPAAGGRAGARGPGRTAAGTSRAAHQLARESLTEARRSVHALRPQPLETARLGEALAEVAERWSALHGVPASVTTTGRPGRCRRTSRSRCCGPRRRRWPTWPSTRGATRVGLTLSYHGRRGGAGRARRRRRVSTRRAAAVARGRPTRRQRLGRPGAGSGWRRCAQRIERRGRGRWRSSREPGAGAGDLAPASRPAPARRATA